MIKSPIEAIPCKQPDSFYRNSSGSRFLPPRVSLLFHRWFFKSLAMFKNNAAMNHKENPDA